MTTPCRHSRAKPANASPNPALVAATASTLALGLLLAAISPAMANLVADPGFESCDMVGQNPPPDWTGGGGGFNAVCDNSPHSGSWNADFVGPKTLSQSIATTVGDRYEFSFWLSVPFVFENQPTDFTTSFGPDVVLNLTNSGLLPYTFEDFTAMAAAASTTINFTTTGNAAKFLVDDVSVTAVPAPAPVPEPATLSLLGGALGLLLLARRGYQSAEPHRSGDAEEQPQLEPLAAG